MFDGYNYSLTKKYSIFEKNIFVSLTIDFLDTRYRCLFVDKLYHVFVTMICNVVFGHYLIFFLTKSIISQMSFQVDQSKIYVEFLYCPAQTRYCYLAAVSLPIEYLTVSPSFLYRNFNTSTNVRTPDLLIKSL